MTLPASYDTWKLASPDWDNPIEEIPEQYIEKAENELANDNEKLWNVLDSTVWSRDYLTWMFDNNPQFRQEALDKFPVAERALQLFNSATGYDDDTFDTHD